MSDPCSESGSRGASTGGGLVQLQESLSTRYRIDRKLLKRGNEANLLVGNIVQRKYSTQIIK